MGEQTCDMRSVPIFIIIVAAGLCRLRTGSCGAATAALGALGDPPAAALPPDPDPRDDDAALGVELLDAGARPAGQARLSVLNVLRGLLR